jgi:flagellar L-ring protein precursor FlgH
MVDPFVPFSMRTRAYPAYSAFSGSVLALSVFLIFFNTSALLATSLWNQGNGDLFSERRARSVGDTVTILIEESSTATQRTSTKTSGESKVSTGAGQGVMKFLSLNSADSKSDFNGDGETTRSGSLKARITATIMKRLPNGNYFIKGERKIRVNRETQEIVVTGVVRGEDITPENTVLSSYIADAEIKYKGEGAFGHTQRPGLLQKIVHFLF